MFSKLSVIDFSSNPGPVFSAYQTNKLYIASNHFIIKRNPLQQQKQPD